MCRLPWAAHVLPGCAPHRTQQKVGSVLQTWLYGNAEFTYLRLTEYETKQEYLTHLSHWRPDMFLWPLLSVLVLSNKEKECAFMELEITNPLALVIVLHVMMWVARDENREGESKDNKKAWGTLCTSHSSAACQLRYWAAPAPVLEPAGQPSLLQVGEHRC